MDVSVAVDACESDVSESESSVVSSLLVSEVDTVDDVVDDSVAAMVELPCAPKSGVLTDHERRAGGMVMDRPLKTGRVGWSVSRAGGRSATLGALSSDGSHAISMASSCSGPRQQNHIQSVLAQFTTARCARRTHHRS